MKDPKKEKTAKRTVTFSDQAGNFKNNNNLKTITQQVADIIDKIKVNLDFKSTEKEKIDSLEKVIYNI